MPLPLPPGQQLVAPGKWPSIGERSPRRDGAPWTVTVVGEVEEPLELSLAQLQTLPQKTIRTDIHCVTRWSKLGVEFAGVPLAMLLERARPTAQARFVSFVARSERGHSTSLPLGDALAVETLVALNCQGQPLAEEHGGPVRIVTPGRYFYKSLKWLETIELLADDRLGYWESEAGYHNVADPWQEQRYLASQLDRRQVQELLASRDFSRRDLRGIDAGGRELSRLNAQEALLRDANFRRAILQQACFDGANLSNAHFAGADLRQASFRQADVEGADFSAADLAGCDFSGASLIGASFVAEIDGRPDPRHGARLDALTRFDPSSLEDLTPLQAEYVRAQQGGG